MACVTDGTGKNEEAFVIRRATSLDDLQWVMKMSAEVGFTPRAKEAECYFLAGLTPYFYIGEVNGKRIGCISLVQHETSVAIGGYYIVDKPYRGAGYGKKMFDFCTVDERCSIQTCAVLGMKEHHQRKGFKPTGRIIKLYEFSALHAAKGLASCQVPPSVEILPASQVDFEKMFAYSAAMLGTSQTCKSLLAAWICYLQESSWVAIDDKGEVVGYLIMSETIRFPDEGYYILPLYADSVHIARSLLKVAAEFAIANNPGHNEIILYADTPVDFNPDGVAMLETECEARTICDLVFMTDKEIPCKGLSKTFSLAGVQVLPVNP